MVFDDAALGCFQISSDLMDTSLILDLTVLKCKDSWNLLTLGLQTTQRLLPVIRVSHGFFKVELAFSHQIVNSEREPRKRTLKG